MSIVVKGKIIKTKKVESITITGEDIDTLLRIYAFAEKVLRTSGGSIEETEEAKLIETIQKTVAPEEEEFELNF